MNRRRVLTALAGLGLTGGSVWVAQNGLPAEAGVSTSTGTDGSGSATEAEAGLVSRDYDDFPTEVDTIDARGSEPGTVRVPAKGKPTLIDLFATWCPPCKKQMKSLSTLHGEYGGRVAFVSVTSEKIGGALTKDDVREWWTDHDGNWTLGHDPKSNLASIVGAPGLPYLVLTDASGTVRWEHAGFVEKETLQGKIEQVLES